ncbi:helix-turn-helix domain-containing protein [Facklamia hominis]|uniref:response regulator transcription factor n=1 Tax=Facklamia hominis TaxID=178214 RepID=UPI000C79A11A|nr:helix-turn-helix domain-containing protein [Facklamia hominis]PKY93517.1 hypothetical protein CYJ56_01980 [Facklamia hominis]
MINAIVIDDERSVFEIIDKIIKIENLPIKITNYISDGKSAIEYLKNNKVELIFIDIRMPFASGLDVMRNYPDNTYVVVTAYDKFSYAQEALRLGAKDILLKPIDRRKLTEMIQRLFSPEDSGNSIVNEIIYLMNHKYNERDFSVSKLAEHFFMQPSNLSRLFKKHTGKTIMNYLSMIRINEGKKLLIDTNDSVKEISYRVGYNSPEVFLKHFNKQTNNTPTKYRREHKS